MAYWYGRAAHRRGDGNAACAFLGARAFLSAYAQGEGVVGQWDDAEHLPAGDRDLGPGLLLPWLMHPACLWEWIVLGT